MRAILCMLLLWQTCAPLCMPRLIGLPNFTSPLRWQTCEILCIPRPSSLPYFTLPLLWQTCMPLCMPRQIVLPYLTSLLLWQTCTPLCMPRQIGVPYFTLSLPWLAVTPFTCSCCWLTPFLILMRLWHCLCCCRNGSCSYTRHNTNPPWYKLKASCCKEGIPKRFCNDGTMVPDFFLIVFLQLLVQHTIPTTFNSHKNNFNEIIMFQNSPVQPLLEAGVGFYFI